ncbi:T9SS type B sorting domain-containing protein [Ascidiimonas sp. W6]|uniref:T9SS type B sorting domain-containing protein n=1 Tax=Ascidiimonas meishanensis TaxID=3128903 RepID=UPI0030EB4D3C
MRVHGQLGFCNGNSGDAIFTETFGTGIGFNSLPSGTTTYAYTNAFPDDGFYTVSNGTFGNAFDWHQLEDHTPGDVNGKCLIVNAGFTPGEFYRTTISGLCEATTYEFSAWLLNLVKVPGFCVNQGIAIPVNVSFEIWDITDIVLLASGNTGDILENAIPEWEKYGLVFQTLAGQNQVILKMINNGSGGCGNDLAIDDIEFKSCGDEVIITDSSNITTTALCSTQTPFATTLTATPDFSVYSSHFYQWQESTDGINWTDLVGEINENLFVSTTISRFYRVKVAEFAINIGNPQCISFSDNYQVIINQLPPAPSLACWETATINNATCSWDISGTQPEVPLTACWETATFNNSVCAWEVTGTQPPLPIVECWETASFNNSSCSWEVTGTKPETIFEETRILCGNELVLQADTNFQTPTYLWSTGAITESIQVDTLGEYSVEIFDGNCSFEKIIYTVTISEAPIIESVVSDGIDMIVFTANSGDFLYSLDGISFQSNNVFYAIEAGWYTIYVKEQECDFEVSTRHLHFYIPKYFTPNNDGINDTFNLKDIEFYGSSQVFIFDRYGKLLKSANNVPFKWDGTFNNKKLPSTDYWYRILIEGQVYTGHITLKR